MSLPPPVYRLSARSMWGRKSAGCAFGVCCSPVSHPAPGRSWGSSPSHPTLWWSPSHRFSYMPMDVLVPAPGHVGVNVTNVSPVCRYQLFWHPGHVYGTLRDAPVAVGVATGRTCLALETEVRAQALGWRADIGLTGGRAHHRSGEGYLFIWWPLMHACTFCHAVLVCVIYFCQVAVVIYAYVKTEKEAKKNFQNGDFELGVVCSSQNSSAAFEGDMRSHDF